MDTLGFELRPGHAKWTPSTRTGNSSFRRGACRPGLLRSLSVAVRSAVSGPGKPARRPGCSGLLSTRVSAVASCCSDGCSALGVSKGVLALALVIGLHSRRGGHDHRRRNLCQCGHARSDNVEDEADVDRPENRLRTGLGPRKRAAQTDAIGAPRSDRGPSVPGVAPKPPRSLPLWFT
jgi:hypothetical protein